MEMDERLCYACVVKACQAGHMQHGMDVMVAGLLMHAHMHPCVGVACTQSKSKCVFYDPWQCQWNGAAALQLLLTSRYSVSLPSRHTSSSLLQLMTPSTHCQLSLFPTSILASLPCIVKKSRCLQTSRQAITLPLVIKMSYR